MYFRRRISFRGALLALVIALAAFAGSAFAQTYNFRVLHRFSGSPNDGAKPLPHVEFDADGNLYGTTAGGGFGAGAIFKIANDGTESLLYSIDSFANAVASVTMDPATGDMYGTMPVGGSSPGCIIFEQGCGILYKVATDGTYTLLKQFGRSGDAPGSRLVLDPQGNLYGTTQYGEIYKVSASGRVSTLYKNATSFPVSVIRDAVGNLYGVTNDFGGGGTAFKLSPNGAFTTLHVFGSEGEGLRPVGDLTRDTAGNLYGATDCCVYKLAPDGTLTVLYDFNDLADGLAPNGGLLLIGGNLYGTTAWGGLDLPGCGHDSSYAGCGTVFKLAPDGTKTTLHNFVPSEGARPGGSLTYKFGRLFGTAYSGGERSGNGTVYSIGVATP
ncbi:MAG: hypothetical protein QM719_12640 [Thermomonas sp.]